LLITDHTGSLVTTLTDPNLLDGPWDVTINVHLHGPLGLLLAPNGDLITANGDAVNSDANQPSELVEFTPSGQAEGDLSG